MDEHQHRQHSDDTGGMLKMRFAFHEEDPMGQAGVTLLRRLSRKTARSKKEKGGLSPSLSRVAGLLPRLGGLVTSLASPRLSIKNRCAKICTGSVTWMSRP